MIPALVLLQACLLPTDAGKDRPAVRLERSQTTRTTDLEGLIEIEIEVPRNASSFQITGDGDELVSFDQLIAPDGEIVLDWHEWIDNEEQLTLSFVPQRTTTALSWPIREQDGPLQAGTWTVWLSIYDERSQQPAREVEVELFSDIKIDPNLDAGRVSVQVVWASGVEEEPGVSDAVDEAIERWADIWGERGVKLSVHHVDSDLDRDLGFTFTGDGEIEDLADEMDKGELQLVIGETVDDVENLLGLTAGIPGTIEPSPNTFVVLSWLNHAGLDGEFDEEEIRIMGETMAHETGHYMGLFHPVESDQSSFDALDDTARCESSSSCEDALGDNLMFPYPICTSEGCPPQGDLSGDQAGVMHRYVGVL